ncbi:hypothetical protein Pan153_11300 [Gimesia panareensis]|uniref:Uncharacterized protein n=1 Tax=Gimesia panareensis TaxID=2527978 RepID=A0A518FJP6_9PLAN|nr:hypothetical protein Pan110_25450 [Gimesia panareensis]QDV16500.1 hypothetical protein Pan153_11300 [Gimesia panareensis]
MTSDNSSLITVSTELEAALLVNLLAEQGITATRLS